METNEFGDVQYIETRTFDDGAITWNELDPFGTWTIKNPRKECNQGILRRIEGCKLYRNPRAQRRDPVNVESSSKVPFFLLRPQAAATYDLQPRKSEAVILTCSAFTPNEAVFHQTCFILFSLKSNPVLFLWTVLFPCYVYLNFNKIWQIVSFGFA